MNQKTRNSFSNSNHSRNRKLLAVGVVPLTLGMITGLTSLPASADEGEIQINLSGDWWEEENLPADASVNLSVINQTTGSEEDFVSTPEHHGSATIYGSAGDSVDLIASPNDATIEPGYFYEGSFQCYSELNTYWGADLEMGDNVTLDLSDLDSNDVIDCVYFPSPNLIVWPEGPGTVTFTSDWFTAPEGSEVKLSATNTDSGQGDSVQATPDSEGSGSVQILPGQTVELRAEPDETSIEHGHFEPGFWSCSAFDDENEFDFDRAANATNLAVELDNFPAGVEINCLYFPSYIEDYPLVTVTVDWVDAPSDAQTWVTIGTSHHGDGFASSPAKPDSSGTTFDPELPNNFVSFSEEAQNDTSFDDYDITWSCVFEGQKILSGTGPEAELLIDPKGSIDPDDFTWGDKINCTLTNIYDPDAGNSLDNDDANTTPNNHRDDADNKTPSPDEESPADYADEGTAERTDETVPNSTEEDIAAPADEATGKHSPLDKQVNASATITESNDNQLANTGSDMIAPLTVGGLLMLAIGAGALFTRRQHMSNAPKKVK